MNAAAKPLQSCLWALSAMLCMVAVLFGGMATVQSHLRTLDHEISGDLKLPDGGWLSTCSSADDCSGHAESVHVYVGLEAIGPHHHHHFSETAAGILSGARSVMPSSRVMRLDLRPGEDNRLVASLSSTIDQPPRP